MQVNGRQHDATTSSSPLFLPLAYCEPGLRRISFSHFGVFRWMNTPNRVERFIPPQPFTLTSLYYLPLSRCGHGRKSQYIVVSIDSEDRWRFRNQYVVPVELVMSRDQNAGRSHGIKIGNNSFERMEEFKYLGTILTNQNSIQEEVKSRLKSGWCSLSFGAESLVFHFAVEKFED
jgi:hypothetical protein